jgi:hypothetical protein
MPSLRDNGVLCTTLSTRTTTSSSWIFQKLAAEQLPTRASSTVRQGRRHGPPYHRTNFTRMGHTLLQLARRAAVLGHLSSLRPQWSLFNFHILTKISVVVFSFTTCMSSMPFTLRVIYRGVSFYRASFLLCISEQCKTHRVCYISQ